MQPAIADHKLVLAELEFKVPEAATVTRKVWEYGKADWDRMRDMLTECDWGMMACMTPSDAAENFNKTVLDVAQECIPQKELRERKSTHPWLTMEVERLVGAKQAAEGTDREREAAEACSIGILDGLKRYAS